jgi:hypothetical protein
MGLLAARKGFAALEPGGKRAKKRWSMGGRVNASFMYSLADAMAGGGLLFMGWGLLKYLLLKFWWGKKRTGLALGIDH